MTYEEEGGERWTKLSNNLQILKKKKKKTLSVSFVGRHS
jgi:hypothetical protein